MASPTVEEVPSAEGNILESKEDPKFSLVLFDLETTGLEADCEILQIAAKCGDKTYNDYVMPVGAVPEIITKITGLSLQKDQLLHHGVPVSAIPKETAAGNFVDFLRSVGGKVVLVAHNCFNFDGPLLVGFMEAHAKIQQFRAIVDGFSDSLPLFRDYLLDRHGARQFKLVALARDFLGENCDSHNAVDDVDTLERLMTHEKIAISVDDVLRSRRSVSDMVSKHRSEMDELATLRRRSGENVPSY